MKIGFLGQGFIGKNLADNFEMRGYKDLVRYSTDPKYKKNKSKIKKCDVVFIAVPTPTTPDGFDDSILAEVIKLTGKGSTVVIKSTILPTTARKFHSKYSDRYIMHCPEFLSELTAREDTDLPERNIIGVADVKSSVWQKKAKIVLDMLPIANYDLICSYEEAAFIKYAGNCFFYVKNMFFNIFYDTVQKYGGSWEVIREAVIKDSRIHPVHTEPFHKGGRGAGGHCLIKDFAALSRMLFEKSKDDNPIDKAECLVLLMNESLNKELLELSKKDLDLLNGVYYDK